MFKVYPLIVVLVLASCSTADTSSDDASVLALQLSEIEQITTPDVDTYLSYFETGAVLLPPDRKSIHGKEAAFAFYTSAFETVQTWRLEYSEPIIEVSGDLAVRRYTGTAELTFDSEEEKITVSTKYLDVLKRQPDGTWKISIHSWGADD